MQVHDALAAMQNRAVAQQQAPVRSGYAHPEYALRMRAVFDDALAALQPFIEGKDRLGQPGMAVRGLHTACGGLPRRHGGPPLASTPIGNFRAAKKLLPKPQYSPGF